MGIFRVEIKVKIKIIQYVAYVNLLLLHMYLDFLCTDSSCKIYRDHYMVPYKYTISTQLTNLDSTVKMTGLPS